MLNIGSVRLLMEHECAQRSRLIILVDIHRRQNPCYQRRFGQDCAHHSLMHGDWREGQSYSLLGAGALANSCHAGCSIEENRKGEKQSELVEQC